MNKQFIINNHANLISVISHLLEMKIDNPIVVDIKSKGKSRSLSQNALFHKWCGEISDFLIKKGKNVWTPEFTKDSLKHTFLGYEDIERTNMETGVIRVSSELKHTRMLEVNEMYFFMRIIGNSFTLLLFSKNKHLHFLLLSYNCIQVRN